MSDMDPASEYDIEQVSGAWLASRAVGSATDDWVENWQVRREMSGDYTAIWRFVVKLCENVASNDSETIGLIGAGPLWDMIYTWPDKALSLIEAEVATNRTLVEALSIIVTDESLVRERIDAILARHGGSG